MALLAASSGTSNGIEFRHRGRFTLSRPIELRAANAGATHGPAGKRSAKQRNKFCARRRAKGRK